MSSSKSKAPAIKSSSSRSSSAAKKTTSRSSRDQHEDLSSGEELHSEEEYVDHQAEEDDEIVESSSGERESEEEEESYVEYDSSSLEEDEEMVPSSSSKKQQPRKDHRGGGRNVEQELSDVQEEEDHVDIEIRNRRPSGSTNNGKIPRSASNRPPQHRESSSSKKSGNDRQHTRPIQDLSKTLIAAKRSRAGSDDHIRSSSPNAVAASSSSLKKRKPPVKAKNLSNEIVRSTSQKQSRSLSTSAKKRKRIIVEDDDEDSGHDADVGSHSPDHPSKLPKKKNRVLVESNNNSSSNRRRSSVPSSSSKDSNSNRNRKSSFDKFATSSILTIAREKKRKAEGSPSRSDHSSSNNSSRLQKTSSSSSSGNRKESSDQEEDSKQSEQPLLIHTPCHFCSVRGQSCAKGKNNSATNTYACTICSDKFCCTWSSAAFKIRTLPAIPLFLKQAPPPPRQVGIIQQPSQLPAIPDTPLSTVTVKDEVFTKYKVPRTSVCMPCYSFHKKYFENTSAPHVVPLVDEFCKTALQESFQDIVGEVRVWNGPGQTQQTNSAEEKEKLDLATTKESSKKKTCQETPTTHLVVDKNSTDQAAAIKPSDLEPVQDFDISSSHRKEVEQQQFQKKSNPDDLQPADSHLDVPVVVSESISIKLEKEELSSSKSSS
jgi:hypothetical protein